MPRATDPKYGLIKRNPALAPEKFQEYLRDMLERSDPKTTAKLLKSHFHKLAEPHEFRPGQLVAWKHGLRNRVLPSDGQPAIVIEVLKKPIYDEVKESGSPHFREPLDIVLGILDPDGDLMVFHFDSRRFQPFEEKG